ncbi:hypothetical protein H5410_049971 [Solanum commersonii]|uniref:RRM domain-containing protein n=1 Tax=Solanum commersonii TaxID=4109 RepID=A0A9J5WWJ5_SOLCO|nr:hypothetical protein H5410_049971 [Solanum commersonii]
MGRVLLEVKMRPIFVGNFEFDTRQSELERFFSKYGRIERVDMKSGTSTKEKELLSWLNTSVLLSTCLLSSFSLMELF